MTDGSCRSGWKVGLLAAAFSACLMLASFGSTGGCWAKACQSSEAIASPSIATVGITESDSLAFGAMGSDAMASESAMNSVSLRQSEPLQQWLVELTKRSLRGAWFTLEDQVRRHVSRWMWRESLSRFTIPVDRNSVPIVGYTLD